MGIHQAVIFSTMRSLLWNQTCGSSAEYQLPTVNHSRRIPLSSFQSRVFVGRSEKVIDYKPSANGFLITRLHRSSDQSPFSFPQMHWDVKLNISVEKINDLLQFFCICIATLPRQNMFLSRISVQICLRSRPAASPQGFSDTGCIMCDAAP